MGLVGSIDNDFYGTDMTIGTDTALLRVTTALDQITSTAASHQRTFVVEVMGGYCGYLALMGGLASGAERIYMNEDGVTIDDLRNDLSDMIRRYQQGKRLTLMIRNEYANPLYTTSFMSALFAEEGKDLFDVQTAILGHQQQGGSPSPFDRIQATRLAAQAIAFLISEAGSGSAANAFIGVQGGKVHITNMEEMPRLVDAVHSRPKEQWWLGLKPLTRVLSQLGAAQDASVP